MPAATHLDSINWFELPTTDLERATLFYEHLLAVTLTRAATGEPMSVFPSSMEGVGGALVQRALQQPSAAGALVYLNCDSGLETALSRLDSAAPGSIIVPKTEVPGGFGHFACIRDSEGNHVGLHEH